MAAALAVLVAGFYLLLARREEPALVGLPCRAVPAAGAAAVARSERSTWFLVALFLLLSWV